MLRECGRVRAQSVALRLQAEVVVRDARAAVARSELRRTT